MNSSLYVYYLLLGVVICDDSPLLRFYYRSIDDYKEFNFSEAYQVLSTQWYNPNRTTVIFTHGFRGNPQGPAVTAVIKSYLEQGKSNVALLNWEKLAAPVLPSVFNSYANWAAPNARKVGQYFAETLLNLSDAGLNLDNIHLIGHSLGAHLFGIAGNTLSKEGTQVPWITGLDPASVGFETRPLSSKLHAGSAGFVDVIHSDPDRYGYKRQMGTVDFWPNYRTLGPVIQPGCDNRQHSTFSMEDLCNHNRSWQILVDTLKYPGTIIGRFAENYRKWKNYSQQDGDAIVLEIGVCLENIVPGNYYFRTFAESPYGMGSGGLYP
ncbi:lipase member H-B-like [Achroia grisella]|uniref:lipase member H-B-like n=1 Tax=Achroia grisella TaxID=688607 RepID=UPI0027D2C698|nr:lipase member H-B-like [Achroia grisella]